MSATVKGGLTLLLILSFPLSVFVGYGNQFLTLAAIAGFLWVIFGNLFTATSKVIGKVIPDKAGGTVNPPPNKSIPPPPPPQRPTGHTDITPVSEMVQGNTHAYTPSGDNRKDTAGAISVLPNEIPLEVSRDTKIKILYDGKRWYTMNLGRDGHWGIFGTTGSGKGNAIRLIALSVLELGPDVATLTVLDGKGGLDYSFCLDVAHAQLFYKDPTELTNGAQSILAEMRRRQDVLFEARVENIHEYNKIAETPLPLQVVIADELLSFDSDAKAALGLFAAQSRALGGVLIIATQYPTVDVIPNQVQANVTNRLVGRLASSEHTRVALRRTRADNSAYEPAMIPLETPGVMVLRQDSGNEILGRSPKFTRDVAKPFIGEVVAKYPNVNSKPPRPAQSVTGVPTGASESAITTSPLTEDEKGEIVEWVDAYQDQGVTQYRRKVARKLYEYRGGKQPDYNGSGPLYQIVQRYLDEIGA